MFAKKFHIDFVKYRFVALAFSCSMVLAFFVVAGYRYYSGKEVFSYSIDFTGGTQVLLKFTHPMEARTVKAALEEQGWQGVNARDFSLPEEVMIRVKEFSNDAKGLGERMKQAIQAAMPDENVEILQSEGVGPGVGSALRTKSIWAVLICLIILLFYVAVRYFSMAFALGAVIALFHDAIIMLACFMLLGREISVNVIAAILAVLGYSINDTIVIYSRIRENLITMRGASLGAIINQSLNETLRRTILTSVSTALAVGALFVLGGEGLRDFSLAMLIGIVFGTYSSIFIASPIIMMFYRNTK